MEKEKYTWEDRNNNPCWVVFLHPFTFVVPNDENPWEVNLEDINNISYSNGNLIRIVTKFEIDNSDLCGLICYDGAIAIPKSPKFKTKELALNYFSLFFAKLILSNFYVEGIDHKDIVNGWLSENWSIWPTELGNSSISNLHSKIRMLNASNMDTISLANPRIISVEELLSNLKIGEEILNEIPNLNPKFLIRGLTEFRYKNWDLVLSNLWITIEQLVDFIWNNKFLKNSKLQPKIDIPNRLKTLKEDSRTYSASVKQEILYQTNYIDEETLKLLSRTRKIRNKLVHEGISVEEHTGKDIVELTSKLLKVIVKNENFKDFNFKQLKSSTFPDFDNIPDFKLWNQLPNSEFIEAVFGPEIVARAKKNYTPPSE